MTTRPTLLVFTLGPATEARRRPLLPTALRARESEIRAAGLAGALEAGRQNGCRLVVCSPAELALGPDVESLPQTGAGFGQRLAEAFGRVGQGPGLGREPVVVVGTDVPGLAPRHVREALELLAGKPRRVVLGPSPDGGLYLIASRHPLAGLLRKAGWCRRDTLARLCMLLRGAGFEVALLEPLADLDQPADLECWLAAELRGRKGASPSPWALLAARLRGLLSRWKQPLEGPAMLPPPPSPIPMLAGRAPPGRLAA